MNPDLFNFETALTHLKARRRVCRAGWNGKGMWIVLIHPGNSMHTSAAGAFDMQPCIGMKTAQGQMQPGWIASQADLLAEDWMTVDDAASTPTDSAQTDTAPTSNPLNLFAPETIEHLFIYHPPTEETAPLYKSIREMETLSAIGIEDAFLDDSLSIQQRYDGVTSNTKLFAEEVIALVPNGAHAAAAILAIGLARNAANEGLTLKMKEDASTPRPPSGRYLAIAKSKLEEARWLANTAIACGSVSIED